MTTAPPQTSCSRHRRRVAVTTCVTCGRALCPACVVHTPVGIKCATCTASVVDAPRRTEPGPRRPGWRLPTLVAAGLVVLVGAVAYAVVGRGGGDAVQYARPTQPSGSAKTGPTDVSLQFAGAGGLLLGADVVTPGGSSRSPGVLIVPDTGPADRNGPIVLGSGPDPLYGDLAQELAKQGVASLRYDPRGQGQSTLPAGTSLRFPDVVADARAGLSFLAGRDGVDPSRVSVLGEGAGGLVAMQLAAQDPSVKALVLVSAPARPMPATLADQVRAAAATPQEGQALAQQLQSVAAALIVGAPVPSLADLPSALRPIFPAGEDAFLRSLFFLDPLAVARTIRLPTLIVQGGADPSPTQSDAQALVAALGPQAQLALAPQANHTLNIVTMTAANTPVPPGEHPGMHDSVVGRVSVDRDHATLAAIATWVGAKLHR